MDLDVMHRELTSHVPRVAYENLINALMYERDSINAAYDSLFGLVYRGLSGDITTTHVTSVLQGLTAMLRFIFERVYHHTSETSMTFLRESGAVEYRECAEAVSSLHEAIMVKVLSTNLQKSGVKDGEIPSRNVRDKLRSVSSKRCVFAVSSHYGLETQREILDALTRKLNHTTVVLQRCEATKEMGLALQLGCHVLISPFSPTPPYVIAYATKEKVLQYAQSSSGEEDDDELNALLYALDSAARNSPVLIEYMSSRDEKKPQTTVVSRTDLQGTLNNISHNIEVTDESHDTVTWENTTEMNVDMPSQSLKRLRRDSSSVFPLIVDFTVDVPPLLSQVIQYQIEEPTLRKSTGDLDSKSKTVPDPSRWCFQISNSLKETKNELVKAIRHLGGYVENSSAYNPQTTHLVVAEGLAERTEKYLSCCAALKFIVPPAYVLDSFKRGKWLVDRIHEYDRNPLRRLGRQLILLPFTGWHVVLFTSTVSVNTGVVTVLKAGGCTNIISYIFADTEIPNIDSKYIEESSHLLVECQKLSSTGRFMLPSWFPHELKRQDNRFFSLELLFYLLCFSTVPLFDEKGQLLDTQQLPLSCRLEFC